ncbi:MAG TPA: M20/M25/M40 family metallo-hydrolase [Candidatus Limnocylindria bacterium]|jgi:acetylornithine deacetylase/succinyl-diaminopimelate desuccinylase-like protein
MDTSRLGPDPALAAAAERITADLRPAVRALLPALRADLERLIRVPSMSARGYEAAPVRESASITADILRAAGAEIRILEREGAHPAVVGSVAGPAGTPTVLLYAHHDVQPPGPRDRWASDPFEPVERNGRLYGRGSSDDKAGIVAHAAAIRAWGGKPPVNVAFFIEGEEESGSDHLGDFLAAERALLDADAVVIADSGNWRVGEPAITTTLRGNVLVTVEVRTADHAVHSGEYGGSVPDANMALVRLLASLHDDRGSVAVRGLRSGEADALDLTEGELRGWVGTRPSVELIGTGTLTGRLWQQPSISITGIDATSVAESSNTIWPVARARISMRIPPGQPAAAAQDALAAHLEAHAPWGAEVTVTRESRGEAFVAAATGPAYEAMRAALGAAWERGAIDIGMGGSIPFLFDFARIFPKAALLVTGVGDPASNPHSEDESLDLRELERGCLAEAVFLGLCASALNPPGA